MKFKVIKPGNTGEMNELTAIDCKLKDRTREIVDRFKDSAQYDEATGCCKVDAKSFGQIESAIHSFNRMEGVKRAVFKEIRNAKGQDEAAKAEQEFYDAFMSGGKYEGKPECWEEALEEIRERHFPSSRLDVKTLVKELQTLEKETTHEM